MPGPKDQPEIIKITDIDPGVLLLETVKNAENITPELQREIARFMGIWSRPQMSIDSDMLKKRLFGND